MGQMSKTEATTST